MAAGTPATLPRQGAEDAGLSFGTEAAAEAEGGPPAAAETEAAEEGPVRYQFVPPGDRTTGSRRRRRPGS